MFLEGTAGYFKELGGFTKIMARLKKKDAPAPCSCLIAILGLLDSTYIDYYQSYARDMMIRLHQSLC